MTLKEKAIYAIRLKINASNIIKIIISTIQNKMNPIFIPYPYMCLIVLEIFQVEQIIWHTPAWSWCDFARLYF